MTEFALMMMFYVFGIFVGFLIGSSSRSEPEPPQSDQNSFAVRYEEPMNNWWDR